MGCVLASMVVMLANSICCLAICLANGLPKQSNLDSGIMAPSGWQQHSCGLFAFLWTQGDALLEENWGMQVSSSGLDAEAQALFGKSQSTDIIMGICALLLILIPISTLINQSGGVHRLRTNHTVCS